MKILLKNIILLTSLLLLQSCMLFTGIGIIAVGSTAIKDKTVGQSLDDAAISMKIKKEFMTRGFKNLYSKINVEVFQGRVLYTGVVENEEDMLTSIDIAWNQSGVKEVVNELEIDKEDSKFNLAQYTKDVWITTRIFSEIFADRNIKFVNYTITTINNVVYVFGLAISEEELDKVTQIAARIKGVEKVVSRVKIKDRSINESTH